MQSTKSNFYNIFIYNICDVLIIYQYKLKVGIQRLLGLHFENGHLIIVTSLRLSIIFHVKLSVRKGNKQYATTICSKKKKVYFLKNELSWSIEKHTHFKRQFLRVEDVNKLQREVFFVKKKPFGQYFDFVKRINI